MKDFLRQIGIFLLYSNLTLLPSILISVINPDFAIDLRNWTLISLAEIALTVIGMVIYLISRSTLLSKIVLILLSAISLFIMLQITGLIVLPQSPSAGIGYGITMLLLYLLTIVSSPITAGAIAILFPVAFPKVFNKNKYIPFIIPVWVVILISVILYKLY